MTLKELEDQIDIKFELLHHSPKVPRMGFGNLNRDNDKEIEERTKIYEKAQGTYFHPKELDTLTKMRYRELIDDGDIHQGA